MPEKTNPLSGFLIIDKPAGITSHDVVDQVRRVAGTKRVGHAGTLDPFATGVLIVGIGNTTRLLEYAKDLPKTYVAEITLGATSDTDDLTGEITPHPPRNESASPSQGEAPLLTKERSARKPGEVEVQAVLQQFLGPIQQIPPAYAAIKVKGKKLYEYAREGKRVERLPRAVIIHYIELISYAYPHLKVEISCSSGTYIRSLARDLGEKLGTGGYVSHLVRNSIHKFHITQSMPLPKLSTDSLTAALKPPEGLVDHFPSVTLSPEDVAKWRQGRTIEVGQSNIQTPSNSPLSGGGTQKDSLPDKGGSGWVSPIGTFNESSQLLGISSFDLNTSLLKPQKVLPI